MYIQIILGDDVSNKIKKVIRTAMLSLKNVFPELQSFIETSRKLVPHRGGKINHTNIFQVSPPLKCRGVIVYITSGILIWRGVETNGLARLEACIVALGSLKERDHKKWTAKVWELILHEVGHSLGLVPVRGNACVSYLGTRHCLNNCVMSDDLFEIVWTKKAELRYKNNIDSPFCSDCRKYLVLSHKNAASK